MSDRGVESRVSAERIEAAAKVVAQYGWQCAVGGPENSTSGHWGEVERDDRECAESVLVAAGVADLESALRELVDAQDEALDVDDPPDHSRWLKAVERASVWCWGMTNERGGV